ncbi:MAG: hypothetical protein JRI68_35465 [Deltaproteobacteria bacterium]|nr:hypothetical protein [Deltaproteobacteria bacterium]
MAAYDRDDRGGTSLEPPGGQPATDPDEPATQGATAKPRGDVAPVLSVASSRASSGTRLSSRWRHDATTSRRNNAWPPTNEPAGRATGPLSLPTILFLWLTRSCSAPTKVTAVVTMGAIAQNILQHATHLLS